MIANAAPESKRLCYLFQSLPTQDRLLVLRALESRYGKIVRLREFRRRADRYRSDSADR